MGNKKKSIEIDHSVIDNATDEQIEAFAIQYSQGDPEAIKAVELFEEAAEKGDASAIRLLERAEKIIQTLNKDFIKRLHEKDPEAVKNAERIIDNYQKGQLTPGETEFILHHTNPAEEDIDKFIAEIIEDPATAEDFLEGLTPSKVKKILPTHGMNPQEEADLTYTREELATLRTGSEEEKAQVKATRRKRAKHFLSSLTMGEFIKLTKAGAPRRNKKTYHDIPSGTVTGINEYTTTKDLLSKAVFGEPGRNGKKVGLVRNNPAFIVLWTIGKGKNTQEVTIYTNLYPNEKALEAAGLTIGKNLSQCAREVYGALLSHYLAGNNLLSLGMIGKIIFNVRNGNDLTDTQEKYIIDGANELFLTTLYVDTAKAKIGEDGNKDKSYISLLEAQKIKITRSEQVFPGRITSAYINGNLVETAIELFKLPTLYVLQNELEKGQILRAPIEILEIPGRMDEDIITIRAYLLRRIDAMKHTANLSHMIIYKNILDEIGIDPADRTQRTRKSRTLKKVERILDYWKEKEYIQDYNKIGKNGEPVKGTTPIYEIKIKL